MSDPLYGLVTFAGRQSATSLRTSRDDLAALGVGFRLFHITHKFKFGRRFWRYWKVPIEDLRCLASLLSQPYDFLLLNPGAELMRRPGLLRLLLGVARFRGLAIFVRWGSCAWLFENKRSHQLGLRRFRAGCRVMSRPGIHHLTLTPQAARDLALATGIKNSFLIYNCNRLPSEYETPAPPQDPPVVVNVASVQARKGPDLFVDVAAEVCRQHPTVKFVWVGGHATKDLVRQIAEYGLVGRVDFVGNVFPPYEWLRRASVVFFPSRSEAFGLAVAEAMACYRTVCCFKGTGAEFAVGDTGLVAPRFDTSLAAQHIIEHLNRSPAERINQRARERYETLFAPRPFAQRLSEILRDPRASGSARKFVAPCSESWPDTGD